MILVLIGKACLRHDFGVAGQAGNKIGYLLFEVGLRRAMRGEGKRPKLRGTKVVARLTWRATSSRKVVAVVITATIAIVLMSIVRQKPHRTVRPWTD
jgi:hypothetical protein